MSEIFTITWVNGLCLGFLSGFIAFFLGKAIGFGLKLFQI